MTGFTFEELKDRLIYGHEVEFTYNGGYYSIEPSIENGTNMTSIWAASDESPTRLAELEIKNMDDLELLFSKPIFDGKSFFEIKSEVVIEVVF